MTYGIRVIRIRALHLDHGGRCDHSPFVDAAVAPFNAVDPFVASSGRDVNTVASTFHQALQVGEETIIGIDA